MWDLCGQTAKLIQHPMDLAVRLSALRHIQFHRDAGQMAVGPPRNRNDYLQITIEFRHRRQARSRLMLALRLQKQLRLIQKPIANRSSCTPPGGI